MKYIKESITYILIALIAWWAYNHTTITLNNTDSVILNGIVKLSAVAMITYLAIGTLTSIGRLLNLLIDRSNVNENDVVKYIRGIIKTMKNKELVDRLAICSIFLIAIGYIFTAIPLIKMQFIGIMILFLGICFLFKMIWIEVRDDVIKFFKEIKENSK